MKQRRGCCSSKPKLDLIAEQACVESGRCICQACICFGSEGDFLNMFGLMLCVEAEQANVESGQACAVSCQTCICFGSVGDLLNMFGPVSELECGSTHKLLHS